MIKEDLIWFVALVLITWLLSHAYRSLAIRWGVLDFPNDRSAHFDPTPLGGGAVFSLMFLAGLAYFSVHGFVPVHLFLAFLGALLVGITGYIDDINSLSVRLRSVAYLAASIWCMAWIDFPELNVLGYGLDLGLIGLLIGALYLVGLLNLYNFMDGIDGIAAGEAVFVAGGASLIIFLNQGLIDHVLLLLLAVTAGFLVINWPKARLFMGDAGSGFLGIVLGILSLYQTQLSFWSWLILLAWFLTDSGLTLLTRWLRGEKIYISHDLHAYQHLTRKIGGTRTLIVILIVNCIWLFPLAFVANAYRDWGIILLLLASMPLLIAQYRIGAGRR